MNRLASTVFGLLTFGPAVFAQPIQPLVPAPAQPDLPMVPGIPGLPAAPPPVALNPNDPLDQHLMRWEQSMGGITQLVSKVARVDIDKVNGTRTEWQGSAAYVRPNLVRLYLQHSTPPKPGQEAVFEYYLLSNNVLREYYASSKKVFIRQLTPPPAGQVADTNQFSLLFGMKAAEAKQRYDISLHKTDKDYVYLKIVPKRADDRSEFSQAWLALYLDSYLPRQIGFLTPNGNEVTWELPQVDLKSQVKKDDFTPPPTPAGWKEDVIPYQKSGPEAQPPPRVARPQKP